MTPEAAFEAALEAQTVSGSDLRLALESVGGSTRQLAEELDVSQRTVQRWLKFERGEGGEARNPSRSEKAGDIRAMADVERDARKLDALAEAENFDADLDLNYASAAGEDEGARRGTSYAPLDLQQAVRLYRGGAEMAEVGAAFASALGASYGLPESLVITNIDNLHIG